MKGNVSHVLVKPSMSVERIDGPFIILRFGKQSVTVDWYGFRRPLVGVICNGLSSALATVRELTPWRNE